MTDEEEDGRYIKLIQLVRMDIPHEAQVNSLAILRMHAEEFGS